MPQRARALAGDPAFGRAVAPAAWLFMARVNACPSILALAFGRVVGLSRWTLVSFAEQDFEGVYVFSVADAFELAIELCGGIVGVAISSSSLASVWRCSREWLRSGWGSV